MPQKNSLQLLVERSLLGTANHLLCHQTPRNRLLDSCDTPKESTTDWTRTSSGNLKVKIYQNWSSWWDSFPEMSGPCLLEVCQTSDDNIMLQMISNLLHHWPLHLIPSYIHVISHITLICPLLDSGLGHVICFDQFDISRHDPSLKCTYMIGFSFFF